VPLGDSCIVPVVEPPRVRGAMLVVARLPSPVRYVATLAVVPDMEAVGVPSFTLSIANLADVVETPPMRRSVVGLRG